MIARLDRDIPVPLYYQMYKALETLITEGNFKPGDRFSTEMELQEKFNVSRATVRNALELLESNGYIFRVTGKGIFISPLKLKIDLPEFLSFSEEMKRKGMIPSTKLIDVEFVDAPVLARNELKLEATQKVLFVRRIRLGDNTPIVYSESYIPEVIGLTEMDDFSGSLYELIQTRSGRVTDEAYHTIEGTLAEGGVAEALGVSEGFPALRFRRTVYDPKSFPLVFETGVIRADQYSYEIRLKRK